MTEQPQVRHALCGTVTPDACTKAARGNAHGTGAQRLPHICGYCANVCRIVAAHSEAACYSKKSSDKSSASTKQEADF